MLRPEHDAFLADDFTMGALTREMPEIAALRQQSLETDFRTRDLAPDVTAAYREAAQRMPVPDPEAVPAATTEARPVQVTPAPPRKRL